MVESSESGWTFETVWCTAALYGYLSQLSHKFIPIIMTDVTSLRKENEEVKKQLQEIQKDLSTVKKKVTVPSTWHKTFKLGLLLHNWNVQSLNYSQDFLMSLQSCYLIPTVVKPTRVRSTLAKLIDDIFVNTPEKMLQ